MKKDLSPYYIILGSRLTRLFQRVLLSLLFLVVVFRSFGSLPPGWVDTDLGAPAKAGSAFLTNGTWTVVGTGTDVCVNNQFHFARTRFNGDGAIVAQVVGVQSSNLLARAGILFRDDSSSSPPQAALMATASSGLVFQLRTAASGSCVVQATTNVLPPVWLKLARQGNDFTAFYSPDGLNWNQIGSSQTVVMNPTALVGLAVADHDNSSSCVATFTDVSLPAPRFGVFRQLWTHLDAEPGNDLSALTNRMHNPGWPNQPNTNYSAFYADFETESDTGMSYYGQRLRAFVVPPTNGNYTFWIASDDTSELLLSPDEDSAHATSIAGVSTFCTPRQWTKEAGQRSGLISLVGGRRYYLEALMQQGTGGDNLAVRWQLPDGSFEEPLTALSSAGSRLVPFTGATALPGIFVQPSDVTVSDGDTAVFAVFVTNQAPVSYQWRLNGTNLNDLNSSSSVYTITNTIMPFNHRVYECVLTSSVGSVTSAPASLTVIGDDIPPTVRRGFYLDPTHLEIVFSEAVEIASATNIANYVFTNGLGVFSASLAADAVTATLTTEPLTLGSNYVLVLNSIRDLAHTPNSIASNTTVSFLAAPYLSQDIGGPVSPGNLVVVPGGYNVRGGGTDIGGSNDQFQFAFKFYSGDFDVRVKVSGLTQTDGLTKAGLMAREDLTPGSRFAAVLSTPSIWGSFFSQRSSPGGAATTSGNVPVNYPDHWLRLKRLGDQFSGFASYDGVTWQSLGSATIVMTNPLCLGMAVCSHVGTNVAAAQFRGLSDVTNAVNGSLFQNHEPLGPSSRRTGLAITEIMYHPSARADGRNLEFVELFNSQAFFEDISGYSLAGDVSFTFPSGTILPAGAFLVIAASPGDLQAEYGLANVVGPYTNSLSNKSGKVLLRNRVGAVLLEISYQSEAPWPLAADGTGHSLVLANPSFGEGSPLAWAVSDRKGGSPGMPDGIGEEPTRPVVINEFIAHTVPPALDAIELYNSSSNAVDLSGCYLSDDPSTNKFRIPSGTSIPPLGFLVFDEVQLGFQLSAAGETLYFVNASDTRVLDVVRFGGQLSGVSCGRYPDGGQAFRALGSVTLGTNNNPPLVFPVVINEIMYAPISGDADDQYVELYNRGTNQLDLGGWSFTAGISYVFPTHTVLAPDGYLVVARNAARMLSNYPGLNIANLVGNFAGSLSGKGEHLTLSMPELLISTNASGRTATNLAYVVVNEVTYGTGGRWGRWAHAGGSSLELIDPHSDNSLAPNWADSDETAKAPWTGIEYTGVLDLGSSSYPPNQLQLFLQDAGECLVDNVEVFKAGQANRITNPNFNNGVTGWFFQGTQRASSLESSGGFGGGPCLHLRASGRGDTGANRVRTALSSSLAAGDTVTLRAKARWLKGNPELLLRLRGNWLEATGPLALPGNLGTPGARNSRFVGNAGPAITDVSHSPVLPAAGQNVIVTCRVNDPDGIASVRLTYRNDTSGGASSTVEMLDNGSGVDAVAGDHLYSAAIPGQNSRNIVAFYIQAIDAAGTPMTALFPNDAPVRECLVGFGESAPVGTFGVYRTWLTKKNISYWASREKNSNDPIDATFAYGNFRAVYNMVTLYSGSPFHTPGYDSPTGSSCDYVLSFPDDDVVLGANDFVIATLGNLGNDPTAQREQTAFWMLKELGVPSLHRRHVFMYVNGVNRGFILEDSQQPNSDHVAEYFPNDTGGHLHKIEDWFEFDDSGSSFNNEDATLDNFTTTGGAKKVARYRWNWRPRAVRDTANDFTNLFNLVDALHAARPEPYTTAVEAWLDVDEWMHTLAVERLVGNWDSFAYSRGKNMFAYKPQNGPWRLLAWDIDFVLGLGDPANSGLFGGQDNMADVMRSFPPFQRAYWRAFQDAVNGPLQDSHYSPLLDAKYAAMLANGVRASSPSVIKSYISQRRTYLQNQLATVSATFKVNANISVNGDLATLTGTAPVVVKSIFFNGIEWPITWTSVTAWRATVPLQTGVNLVTVLGMDYRGQPVSGASNQVSISYAGTVTSPVGHVVINEIMYHPMSPGAQYVELYNNSSNTAFDLSGWVFNGLGYTFPQGSLIAPNSFLTLAADRTAFGAAYGAAVPLFDTFGGSLQANGETLTLIRPETNLDPELVVAKVFYGNGLPWPRAADGTGSSLQLIDSLQDNWRVGNWAVRTNIPPAAGPQWQYVTLTGAATRSIFLIGMSGAGDVYLDDIKLVAGSVPEAGRNYLTNGDFENPLSSAWTVSDNMTNSSISTSVSHSGKASLHVVATSGGPTISQAIWQNTATLVTNGTYTLSYWYLPSTNGSSMLLRLSGSSPSSGQIYSLQNYLPSSTPVLSISSPGASNSVATSLPPFPPLWINELLADNRSGLTNHAGVRSAWLELYNPSSNSVSLAGLYLANNYTNLLAWAFPADASINPGQFELVFADGLTNLSSPTELHAGFVLAPNSGGVALSRIFRGEPQVLDYVDYTNLLADHSFGSVVDAQSFQRQEFIRPTPGLPNNGVVELLPVTINEWMAGNTKTIRNPITGKFDDWFELYNSSANPSDLSGSFLSDSPSNPFLFQIPSGYLVPPHGFLMVWADNKLTNGTPDLHVNFKLTKAGSSIVLSARDGSVVDAVSFGPQVSDLSQGHYPDGGQVVDALSFPTPRSANAPPPTPPQLANFGFSGNEFHFSWQSFPGKTYQVEYKPDLGSATWMPVSGPLSGSGELLKFTNAGASVSNGFFRVILLP